MPITKSHPKCIVCGEPAERWDAGIQAVQYGNKDGVAFQRAGYSVWLCKTHDPRHKHFDMPDTYEQAIEAIVQLRETIRETYAKYLKADDKLRALKAKQGEHG